MQRWQLWSLPQIPLAQLVLFLQPGRHSLSSLQYWPFGQWSLLGKQSTQVPSSKHRPLLQPEHASALPAPPPSPASSVTRPPPPPLPLPPTFPPPFPPGPGSEATPPVPPSVLG